MIMDTRTSEMQQLQTEGPMAENLSKPLVKITNKKAAQRRSRKRNVGREVVKSGMAASLAVTMMTGLRVLRPMSIHPVASWVFVGLTVVHMLMYDTPGKKQSAK